MYSPAPFCRRRELRAFPLEEIAGYIDWTFFFTAWELAGRFPDILQSPKYGEAARDLYDAGLPAAPYPRYSPPRPPRTPPCPWSTPTSGCS